MGYMSEFSETDAYGGLMPYQYPYQNMQMPGYRPFMTPQQEQPVHGFVYVHGIEGAYAYYLPNGSEMPLFDDDESKNIMYAKRVDQNGRATVDVIDCSPHVEQPATEYATRDDIKALYAEIDQLRSALSHPAHAKE